MDGLDQTVWNSGRFCPNPPEIHLLYILDGLKPSRKNRLKLIPDGFLAFLDGFFFCSGRGKGKRWEKKIKVGKRLGF
jgi:hypothetical protein